MKYTDVNSFSDSEFFYNQLKEYTYGYKDKECEIIDKFVKDKLGGLSQKKIIAALKEKYPENFV